MRTRHYLLLMLAGLIAATSCSDSSDPGGPSGPITENLLAGNVESSWTISEGTYHLWQPDTYDGHIVHDQRPIEWADFYYSTHGWVVFSQAGIVVTDYGCSYRKYFTACEIESKPIDFTQWDSARIYFGIRKEVEGGTPNGSASYNLTIKSNVPGIPDVPLATHTTLTEDHVYDLSLESVMGYSEATVVVYFNSSASCAGGNNWYEMHLVMSSLNIVARRE